MTTEEIMIEINNNLQSVVHNMWCEHLENTNSIVITKNAMSLYYRNNKIITQEGAIAYMKNNLSVYEYMKQNLAKHYNPGTIFSLVDVVNLYNITFTHELIDFRGHENVVVDEKTLKMIAAKFYYADGSNIETSNDVVRKKHLFKSTIVSMFRINTSKNLEPKNNTYVLMN